MSTLADSYQRHLAAQYSDKDQRHMSEGFRQLFDTEVEKGAFTRGTKNLILTGPRANDDCRIAFACLTRGKYSVAMVDARLIVRRLSGQWIPRWTDTDDTILESAECLIVHGLFEPTLTETLTAAEIANLTWFLGDGIQNGVSLLVPMPDEQTDLNALGEVFGELLEKTTEVEYGTATDTKKSKQRTGNVKHGGNGASGKHSAARKRKSATGHTAR